MIKKVLILTCSTGEGHNSAAHALEDALLRAGDICEIVDPVSFQSERAKQAVASLYNQIIKKTPRVFGVIYKLGDLYSSSKLPSPVYWANARYADALRAYILDNQFNCVICTHLYGMEAMTAIRQDPGFSIPTYGVLTDYTCIPFIEETNLNGYFVPTESTKQTLIQKGIPEEKVFVTGIPVSGAFTVHADRETARKELGIAPDKKVYLIMTGGIGCENMMGLCTALLQSLKQDALIYILTGKNEELRKNLQEKYPACPQIRAVPFTRQVPLYMAASDVLLSKPGGLSSTEAAVANIPLVHVNPIPGCETYNARFFAETGMSLCAHDEEEAVSFANELANNAERAEKMRKMQRSHINPHAAQDIIQAAKCPLPTE